jgi:carbon-monoxide dehydrogenase medium subunit
VWAEIQSALINHQLYRRVSMETISSSAVGYAFDPRQVGNTVWCGDDVPFEGDYVEPRDLDAAVALLHRGAGTTRIIAGGQSLLPALRSGMLRAERLVSLRKIKELRAIKRANGSLSIGAEVTFSEFLTSPHAADLPFLEQAISAVGNHTIRNRTTFGGTIAWANPMAALLLSLAMLDAVVVTTHRKLPCVNVAAGVNRNNLKTNEIIVSVDVALPASSRRFAFLKTTARRSGGKALASVAAGFERQKDRHHSIRLGVVGLGDRPWISEWSSSAADVGAHVDAAFAKVPTGRRFDALLPDPAYVRASAAIVCRRLVQEISHG